MAQDITIAGAQYPDVPALSIPLTGGGGNATFVDTSDADAVAGDIASGKTAYVNGTKLTGTGSGGGGGLVCETGTYTPTSDISRPTISFANSHTTTPVYVLFADATGTADITRYTNYAMIYTDWWRMWGTWIPYTSQNYRYGIVTPIYRGNTTGSISNANYILQYNSDTTDDSDSSYPRYWVDTSSFRPYSGVDTRYWRVGRTYKWIAVWAPTT